MFLKILANEIFIKQYYFPVTKYGPECFYVDLYSNTFSFIQISTSLVEFPGGSDCKESACNVGDLDLIPVLGRSPGGGHGNPLQYSCLENTQGQKRPGGLHPMGS